MRALALSLALLLSGAALAVSPDELLDDPVLEQRARDISAGLRCLVCQNQSIDDSDADLAKDLRVLVRERLVAGDSDEAVRQYLVDRYGEYVLLNPRLNEHTLLLWIAAPLLLGVGLIVLVIVGRRPAPVPQTELSAEERAALDALERHTSD
ncbi:MULTISPECIES: cytochrome c-type biogenesis protein [Devosia]|uniref:Cytochrome c-type biogenesis protein n=1 Tax=Devosia litorisediminis TaxID=2829817 RepID=A0A942I691_9HYPH|nr:MULTISPECIES: cytochrome c-type biogenesis protein [Devosia]MBS3849097.1 cytochrome c-type biogenesis protein CcmH [Devosia litorisediminis]MCZ4344902.1 cytochrome c-type biogenesis protein CcmH [Devosia neptuniae]